MGNAEYMGDEEDFLREVEADKEMRMNMNLYKTEVAMKKEEEEGDDTEQINQKKNNSYDDEDDDDQQVRLDELLDGLVLEDDNDKEMNDAEVNEDLAWGGVGQTFFEEGEKAAKDGIAYTGRESAQNVKDKDAA